MRAFLAALLLLLYAVPLNAQTGTPTSWNLRRFQNSALLDTITVSTAQVLCGQPKTNGPNVNPTQWRWGDVASPKDAQGNYTLDCVYNDAARFSALPDGTYEGTAQAVNADGPSGESAPRTPFTRRRPNPPAAPTELRITQ